VNLKKILFDVSVVSVLNQTCLTVVAILVVVKLFYLSFQASAMSLPEQQQPAINKKCTNLN